MIEFSRYSYFDSFRSIYSNNEFLILILDFKRNDEWRVDFTMTCSVDSERSDISSRNNVLIFNFSIFSGRNVNLVF